MSKRNPFTVVGKKGRLSHKRFKKGPKAQAYIPPRVYIREEPIATEGGVPVYTPAVGVDD